MSTKRLLAGAALLLLAASLAARGQQPGDEGLFRVGLPWKDWAFDIRLSEFGVPVEKPDPTRENLLAVVLSMSYGPLEYFADDGREYRLRVFRRSQKNERSGTSLSVEMKPVTPVVGAAEFRAAELKRLERSTDWSSSVRFIVRRGSVKTWEYNDVPVARYATAYEHDSAVYQGGTDTRVGGSTQHLAAFYVKDGVGVTVTLSAASLKEPEEALFRSLLDSVRPVDTSTPSSSFDHYHKGRLLFLQKDYCAAAAALGQALTLERLQRQLDPKSWRDLVSKLTDAHAANGDRARAKEVLDYALAQEPDNPLFHMALARYHATLGETDSALAALGKAFGYMKRENPRAPLPDLKFDAVFNRYMKDEKFVKAVKALRK